MLNRNLLTRNTGCLLAGMLLCCAGFSQGKPLPEKEIALAVANIAAQIKAHYVFPEKGEQIAAHLLQRSREGAFREARSWKGFDSLATAVLRNFSHDGHLYVRYAPETVKSLHAPAGNAVEGEDPFHYGPEAAEGNYGFREVSILEGNLGYIRLSEINICRKSLPLLYAAMQLVANTRALVIDLRNNGGGGSDTGAVLESFFLPAGTPLLQFSSRNGGVVTDSTVSWLTQPKYNKPLFILVNKGTASAAEAFAFALQAHKRASVVGQPSAGAANMNTYYPVNDVLLVSVSTGAPALPGTRRSWEQRGVQPDHAAKEGEELLVARRLAGR